MNFFDEALETKHNYLHWLQARNRRLKDVLTNPKFGDEQLSIDINELFRNHEADITGLIGAECYFWEPRITQLVLASGQQLPLTVKFVCSP